MCFLFLFSLSRLKVRKPFALRFPRSFTGRSDMRILNVAEKNDAAKNIAALLSRGTASRREGLSPYNKIYEFDCQVFGQNSRMVVTSVRGHLLNYTFIGNTKNWSAIDPIVLFNNPLRKVPLPDCQGIKKTLEKEVKSCSKLIIWTDCDREGENIGFEIIRVCKAVKPSIEVHRAVFSDITSQSVNRALRNLETPNEHVSSAVDVRSELDLRIGSAFTRLQTLFLQKAFPHALGENLISFGSCQFPTLGFVVERFKAVSEFKSEMFWHISGKFNTKFIYFNVKDREFVFLVRFLWKFQARCLIGVLVGELVTSHPFVTREARNRLFDKMACEVLFDKCAESGTAVVENKESKPKTKWRPKPLDTIELQKLTSRKFRMTGKETLRIAENLYSRGFISYPRTETNRFSKDINLTSLVGLQMNDARWGDFAQKVLRDGPNPFQGTKSDDAHPPIHPTKNASDLSGHEKQVYELIVRHFLACLSKHAEGTETSVEIDIAGEKFTAKGLMITARNYLEVYPYDKWTDKEIHDYSLRETFRPEICMSSGETSPPDLLTEADLISLMDKHGIGTDATHAEHIETIKARLYVGLQNEMYFVPRTLGMGLVEGYNTMGYPMAKPEMRAELESDLKRICVGEKTPREVLAKHIDKYRRLYEGVRNQLIHLSKSIENYIQVEANSVEPSTIHGNAPCDKNVGKCPTCHSEMFLKTKRNGLKFIGCSGFPHCRIALWLPSFVLDVSATTDECPTCGPGQFLLRFKFSEGSCHLPSDYVGCIGGCDWHLLDLLNCTAPGENTSAHPAPPRDAPPVDSVAAARETGEGFFARSFATESPPLCHCSLPAASLTVKKQGRNHGREFYKCSIKGSRACDFFEWKKEANTERVENSERGEVDDVRCFCSITCRRSVTTKEGPNKGRPFLSCGKSLNDSDKCNFFKWADVDENNYGNRSAQKVNTNWQNGRSNRRGFYR